MLFIATLVSILVPTLKSTMLTTVDTYRHLVAIYRFYTLIYMYYLDLFSLIL